MKAQLKPHNGTPTVFLDDQPVFFGVHLVGYMYPDKPNEHQDIARKYAAAGIHIYSVDNLTHEWVGPRPEDEGQFDFAPVRPRLQSYIDVDPQAKFLMRVGLDTRWSPSSWCNAAYPDEVEMLSDGTRWGQSFASQIWREQVATLLRALIDHLREIGLYDRVLGFQIGAGSSGEWIKDVSLHAAGHHRLTALPCGGTSALGCASATTAKPLCRPPGTTRPSRSTRPPCPRPTSSRARSPATPSATRAASRR